MVTNSKVLTVSYGTFSCTLEGFDDSFDMMKSIAEYFRDLAADDRYFGAEPPTPDAAVLAAIAEKELSQRVVARLDGHAVHLRASDTDSSAASPADDPIAAEEASIEAERQAAEYAAKAEAKAKERQAAEDAAKAEAQAKERQAAEEAAKTVKPDGAITSALNASARFETFDAMVEEDVEDADLTNLRALAERRRKLAENADQTAAVETTNVAAQRPAEQVEPETPDAAAAPDAQPNAITPATPAEQQDQDTAPLEAQQADATPAQAPIAPRVIKMKKADLIDTAAAPAQKDLDGLEEFLADANDIPLSEETDAELLAVLAQVAEETATQHIKQANAQPLPPLTLTQRVQTPSTQTARKALDTSVEVDRILGQTTDVMERPEQQTRHEAYSQMKVAVATSQLAPKGALQPAEQIYRNDLAALVKTKPAPQPAAVNALPLKLVASQRIDVSEEMPNDPDMPAIITPRRIADAAPTKAAPKAPVHTMSFDEYLEKTGASNLPEVLEAAAAYTAFVEGNGAFSRPQVVSKVSQVMSEDFSREDCLKVFGTLLRNGTLRRERGGQFAIDANSRYGDLARAAS